MVEISARNNLQIPIRLTLANTNDGKEDRILITIGKNGAALKSFYGICVDTDLPPNKDWEDIGSLEVENKYRLVICGKEG